MKDSGRVVLLYDRLKDELGYTPALPMSIFQPHHGGRVRPFCHALSEH